MACLCKKNCIIFENKYKHTKKVNILLKHTPPSTGRLTPVENDASSEARKAIAFATSSGSPGRPNACVSLLL